MSDAWKPGSVCRYRAVLLCAESQRRGEVVFTGPAKDEVHGAKAVSDGRGVSRDEYELAWVCQDALVLVNADAWEKPVFTEESMRMVMGATLAPCRHQSRASLSGRPSARGRNGSGE